MKIFDIQNNTLNVVEITTVKLQSNEAITVLSLSNNPAREATSLELRAKGVKSPHQSVYRLKQKGAIIESTRETFTDKQGNTHKGIAHYRLTGWK